MLSPQKVLLQKQSFTRKVIQVHPSDNVVVAIQHLLSKDKLDNEFSNVTLVENISAGHKIAIAPVLKGQAIMKYGYEIGIATQDIGVGEQVHSHNLKTALNGSEKYRHNGASKQVLTSNAIPKYDGYVRKNGRVGIRNEIWIVNTVGCVNQSAKRIADICNKRFDGKADAFVAITHPFGCSQLGDDLDNTQQLLASLMANPNAGGVLVIGLGCENNQLSALLRAASDIDESRLRYFNSQQVADEVEYGLSCIEELLQEMATDKRISVPVSTLSLGMKCGGSDGFSGLTANAIVGRVTDRLTHYGGRVVLTETPEMFGAEQVLMNRTSSLDVFNQTVDLVNSFKQYFIDNNQPIYENPSPGNKQGGLTTLEEKSLGAIQKGGQAIINEVIPYGSKASINGGLTLLEGPGNDAISSTALAAAGANMVLFTTGRGTPLGFPVPTIKISSNTSIFKLKPHWIDFNAGQILTDDVNVDECADKLFDYLLEVASGKLTNNEINDSREISIWKNGVTL